MLKRLCASIVLSISLFVGVFVFTPNINTTQAAFRGRTLERTIDDGQTPTINNLRLQERWQDLNSSTGPEQIRDFIVEITVKVVIPILILAGVLIALIGFYQLMTSNSEEETGKATNYIVRGITGIIIMVSAGFIVTTLVGAEGNGGILGNIANDSGQGVSGALIAQEIYRGLLFPFINTLMSILLGILFIMLIIHSFRYLFSGDADAQRKSFSILIYNTVGILVIVMAKSIVEIIYGREEEVINANVRKGGEDLDGIGLLFSNPNFEIIYTILNRIMGLTAFIVMVIIIYQGYILLVSPDSEDNMVRLRKSFVWIFIGIFVIGASYVISSMLVIS